MGFITWFFYAFVFQCDWRLKPAEIRVCSEWPKSVNCTCINENLKKKRQENTKEIHGFMSLSNAFALILCQFLSWLFASLSFRFFFTEDAFDIISVLPICFKLFNCHKCVFYLWITDFHIITFMLLFLLAELSLQFKYIYRKG